MNKLLKKHNRALRKAVRRGKVRQIDRLNERLDFMQGAIGRTPPVTVSRLQAAHSKNYWDKSALASKRRALVMVARQQFRAAQVKAGAPQWERV